MNDEEMYSDRDHDYVHIPFELRVVEAALDVVSTDEKLYMPQNHTLPSRFQHFQKSAACLHALGLAVQPLPTCPRLSDRPLMVKSETLEWCAVAALEVLLQLFP